MVVDKQPNIARHCWLSRLRLSARLILGTHGGFGICTLAGCVVLLCWPLYVPCTGKSNPHLISMAALYHHRTGRREHGWGWDADSHQGPHPETTARGHREGDRMKIASRLVCLHRRWFRVPASRLRVRCSMGNEVSVPQPGCSPQSWDRYVLRSTYSMLYNALQFRSSAGWLHRGRPTGPFPGTVDTATTPVRAGVTAAPSARLGLHDRRTGA